MPSIVLLKVVHSDWQASRRSEMQEQNKDLRLTVDKLRLQVDNLHTLHTCPINTYRNIIVVDAMMLPAGFAQGPATAAGGRPRERAGGCARLSAGPAQGGR